MDRIGIPMATYKELLNQIDDLMKQAEDQRRKEITNVVAEIRQKMQDYELTIEDLGFTTTPKKPRKKNSPSKYKNPITGESWSGIGKQPKWFKEALATGKTKEELLS
jgi:DNA-binding protein H-NS